MSKWGKVNNTCSLIPVWTPRSSQHVDLWLVRRSCTFHFFFYFFCFQTNKRNKTRAKTVRNNDSVQKLLFYLSAVSAAKSRVLMPFQLMLVCTIGGETKKLKSISVSWRRIASAPTQCYIRHPQQTPSLQSCEPTVPLPLVPALSV